MVALELQYLFEIGRLKEPPDAVLPALQGSLGLVVCDRPFAEVSWEARRLAWTRDPFDRLITAQASVGDARLMTKDETILKNYARAFWS
jgi:PIN domain nuclease of toxin-antitoxin system